MSELNLTDYEFGFLVAKSHNIVKHSRGYGNELQS